MMGVMGTEPIQQALTDEQIGAQLAALTKTIRGVEELERLRAQLMLIARQAGWSQQRIADACPVDQAAVSRVLRQFRHTTTPPI
jgi:hypothetical protein